MKNLTFTQVSYQIVSQLLNVFDIIQVTVNFNQNFRTITFYVSLKHQTLTSKPHCYRRVMRVVPLSWRSPDNFLLIRMQLHPSFIAEYDL